VPVTGPVHGPKKPILLYFFDDTKLPLDPNQWVVWSATAGPAVSSNNKIWDGANWVNMVGSTDGRQAINIDRVGGAAQTGDDWSLRLQALNDPTVLGLAQATGLPAWPTTDATANETLRRFLERVADSADTIGPVMGLMRTLGDLGAIGTAPTTGKTIAKILEDILTALGGIASPQWDSYSTRNAGAVPFTVTVDSTVDGGRIVVSCHASMPILAGNNATIVIETSNDNVNWCPEFTWTITDGGATSQQFFNARRYIRMDATAVAGGTLTMDLASSR